MNLASNLISKSPGMLLSNPIPLFGRRGLLLVFAMLASCGVAFAEDWPWFLGPRHTGVSGETDVNLDWSRRQPRVLWKQSIGTGYSAPSVLGDRVVIHHYGRAQEIVSCRRTNDGSEIWKHEYPSKFKDPYGYNSGPRCSPVLDSEQCFTLGADGILTCLNLEDGKLRWQKDLKKEFDLSESFFGVGCSPLLDSDRLIVLVGGQPNSGVVAFHRHTGDVIWQAVGKSTWDGVIDSNVKKPYHWTGTEMVASYSSPLITRIYGRRHLLCLMRQGLVSLDPETGTENFHYWFRAHVHESVNAARPIVVDGQILLSAAYRVGSVLLRVTADGRAVAEVWKNPENLLAHWSTPLHVDGFVYGFSGRHENQGELRCIRLSDGKVMWSARGYDGGPEDFYRNRATGKIVDVKSSKAVPWPWFGRGSMIQVGDRFIVLGERGTLAVTQVNSQEFQEHARTSFPEIHYPAWAAPVLADGSLYLRSEDWLLCLDLTAVSPPSENSEQNKN